MHDDAGSDGPSCTTYGDVLIKRPYLGVKLVRAEPCVSPEGLREGYSVTHPDGHTSWCPKEYFENVFLPLDREDKITADVASSFIRGTTLMRMDEKTTCVGAETITGFVDYQVSSCVDPKNSNYDIGYELALKKVRDKLFGYLGFVLQWGRNGLKGKGKTDE